MTGLAGILMAILIAAASPGTSCVDKQGDDEDALGHGFGPTYEQHSEQRDVSIIAQYFADQPQADQVLDADEVIFREYRFAPFTAIVFFRNGCRVGLGLLRDDQMRDLMKALAGEGA